MLKGLLKLETTTITSENYNSKTNKRSGIKKFFKANIYIEFANGTNLAYCKKYYNCCKNLAHNPNPKKGEECKCDFNVLSKVCKFCNENCERTFVYISENSEVAGPFEFIFDKNKFNSESEEKKKRIIIV
ncbi:hypothetical protein C2G38_2165270 [Gigaspora rosea]|uniref:Uncharacterized protein n=1 Tax=Gigaspora rosea TaxID=44941 RepID=A0A397W2V0_9GLOM|nr:hypothetical protein C2G38_2165270 [Gigaspora rosea]